MVVITGYAKNYAGFNRNIVIVCCGSDEDIELLIWIFYKLNVDTMLFSHFTYGMY